VNFPRRENLSHAGPESGEKGGVAGTLTRHTHNSSEGGEILGKKKRVNGGGPEKNAAPGVRKPKRWEEAKSKTRAKKEGGKSHRGPI